MVPPIELDKIPDDRLVNDVKGKDLSVESFFLQDNKKNNEIGEIQNGLIKLCGM